MDLEGNLTIFEPISVFQLINLAQATGALTLDVGDNSAKVFFEGGSVTYAYTGSYTYVKGGASYNPGDELTFRGSATLPIGLGRLDLPFIHHTSASCSSCLTSL